MRVRIQYSVDLDEIPQKISGFLKDAAGLIGNLECDLVDEATDMAKGRVSEHSLEMIDNVRQEMAKVDMMLADAHSILSGYLQAKNPPPDIPEVPEVREPEVTDAIPEG